MYYDRKTYEEQKDVWLWVAEKMAGVFRRKKKERLSKIDHMAIQVDDIPAAIAWYREHWDCVIEWSDESWAMLKFDNTRLALVLPSQHPPHVSFLSDQPENFGPTKYHRDSTVSTYIKDPWGNDIELIKRPEWTFNIF